MKSIAVLDRTQGAGPSASPVQDVVTACTNAFKSGALKSPPPS